MNGGCLRICRTKAYKKASAGIRKLMNNEKYVLGNIHPQTQSQAHYAKPFLYRASILADG